MPDIISIAERFASLLALTLLFGSAIFRVRVAQPLSRSQAAHGETTEFSDRLANIAARSATAAAGVIALLAIARLNTHVVDLFDGWRNAGADLVQTLILHTTWGHAWMLQLAAALVILLGGLAKRRLDMWMAVPLAVSAGLGGHAAGVHDMKALAISMDSLHIFTAGGWIGGVWYVFVAFALRGASADVFRVVNRFNVVALTCAAVVVATGTYAAFLHVPSFAALFATPYGIQLCIKLACVLAMLAAGAWNWRLGTPALATGDPKAIRRGVAIELLFALAIVVATARLVILPPA